MPLYGPALAAMATLRLGFGCPGNGCAMALKHSIACRSRVGDPCDCGLPFPDTAPSGLEKPPSPVGRFRATAAEVQAYRQEHQCSMFVARRNCLARNLRLAIEAAKSVDELKPVLVALLQLTDLQT